MNRIAPYAKAITGAVVAGLGAARLALTDDVITRAEGIDISIATLTALALVWAIPNGDTPPTTLVGTVTSETGETGSINATLDVGEAPSEDEDDLTYEEAGGKPFNDYGYSDEARLT